MCDRTIIQARLADAALMGQPMADVHPAPVMWWSFMHTTGAGLKAARTPDVVRTKYAALPLAVFASLHSVAVTSHLVTSHQSPVTSRGSPVTRHRSPPPEHKLSWLRCLLPHARVKALCSRSRDRTHSPAPVASCL